MPTPHRQSKAELCEILLKRVQDSIASGDTAEQAIGKLSERQYDFLIDQGIDFDKLLLTPEQLKTVQTVKRASRTVKPGGYNKKYPQSKQDLYNGIAEYIKSQGATITPHEKCNFRDLDFTIEGTAYRIVLSNPRT